ncbi:MAG: hypothetical protein BroJett026_28390 [Betaproteobacteria bacterium]|nr:MAG: hypothetical protein BroJett026_28390 [Betaproteobacteria bacterium]
MSTFRWQDMVSLVLGVWIAASPWVLGVADALPAAMWNALAVGILVVVLAAIDLDTPAAWEEWAMGALGLWLVVSPWVLGYAASRPLMASSVAAGAAIVALAAWALYAAGDLGHGRRTAH